MSEPTKGSTEQFDASEFYEQSYSDAGASSGYLARWRDVGAQRKADNVLKLCRKVGLTPATLVELGCGDGALLAALQHAGLKADLAGYEISQAPVAAAQQRGVGRVELFDGEHVPKPDASVDLVVLSHVVEHIPDPIPLLREAGRVGRWVVVEVPLEDNLSGRRSHNLEHSQQIGHLHHFSRPAIRQMLTGAGLHIRAEQLDPLDSQMVGFETHGTARLKAQTKALIRRTATAVAPPLAQKLFTLHYTAITTQQY